MNCLRHELCLSARWLQINSCERRIAKQFREQFMAMPIHDATASIHLKKRRARIEGFILLLLPFLPFLLYDQITVCLLIFLEVVFSNGS